MFLYCGCSLSLEEEQNLNETATCRIVGLTLVSSHGKIHWNPLMFAPQVQKR